MHSSLLSPIALSPPGSIFARKPHIVSPARLLHTDDAPVQTNKFYENFLLDDGGLPVYPLPYGLRWENGTTGITGISVSQPEDSAKVFGPDPNANPVQYFYSIFTPSLTISARELDAQHVMRVSDVSGFSCHVHLYPVSNSSCSKNASHITIPVVRGMAFVSAKYHKLTPVFYSTTHFRKIEDCGVLGHGWSKFRITLEDNVLWLVYAKPNEPCEKLNLTMTNTTMAEFTSGTFTGIVQIAKVPVGNPSAEKTYDKSYGAYAVGAELAAVKINGKSGSYSFKWKVAGNQSKPLLHFALPHHVDSLAPDCHVSSTNLSLASLTTGKMTAFLGNTWTLHENELSAVGLLPDGCAASQLTDPQMDAITKQAKLDVASDFIAQTVDKNSVYFSGKGLAKLGLVCLVVNDVIKDESLGAECLTKLKAAMQPFVSNNLTFPWVYDTTWKGIVSSQGFTDGSLADFGNTWYNDHQFHYGYYLHTASIIRKYDEAWGKENEDWINTLLRDAANPSCDDNFFPIFRSFDWYMGHSWAKGIFSSQDGKDIESTSEDVNFYYAMKTWGQVSRKKNIEGLANVMLAVLRRSLQTYFYMKDDQTIQPKNFIKNKVTGILFENKIDHTTYFSNRTEAIHGIHMIPTLPITPYTRDKKFVTEEWNEVLQVLIGNITDGWKSILYMNYIQINPDETFKFFAENPNTPLDDGLARTWALFWSKLHSITSPCFSSSVCGQTSADSSSSASIVHDEAVEDGMHLQSIDLSSPSSCSNNNLSLEQMGSVSKSPKIEGLELKKDQSLISRMPTRGFLRNLRPLGSRIAKLKASSEGLDLLVEAICLLESWGNEVIPVHKQCKVGLAFADAGLHKKKVIRRAKSAYKHRCINGYRKILIETDSKPDFQGNHLPELGITSIVEYNENQDDRHQTEAVQSHFMSRLRRSVRSSRGN